MARIYIPKETPLARLQRGFGAPGIAQSGHIDRDALQIKPYWIGRGLTNLFIPDSRFIGAIEDGSNYQPYPGLSGWISTEDNLSYWGVGLAQEIWRGVPALIAGNQSRVEMFGPTLDASGGRTAIMSVGMKAEPPANDLVYISELDKIWFNTFRANPRKLRVDSTSKFTAVDWVVANGKPYDAGGGGGEITYPDEQPVGSWWTYAVIGDRDAGEIEFMERTTGAFDYINLGLYAFFNTKLSVAEANLITSDPINTLFESANQSPFPIGTAAAAATSQYFIPAQSPITRALRGFGAPGEKPKQSFVASPFAKSFLAHMFAWNTSSFYGVGNELIAGKEFNSTYTEEDNMVVDPVLGHCLQLQNAGDAIIYPDFAYFSGLTEATIIFQVKILADVNNNQILQTTNDINIYHDGDAGSGSNKVKFQGLGAPLFGDFVDYEYAVGEVLTYVYTFRGSDSIHAAINGVLGSVTSGVSANMTVGGDRVTIDGQSDRIGLFAFGDKAISPAEAVAISRDPWRLLTEPANQSPVLIGTAAAGGGVAVTPTGVSATASVGALVVAAAINVTVGLTGVSSTGAVGDLSVSTGASVNQELTGVGSASGIGTLGVTASVQITEELTGISSTGSAGSLDVTTGGNVSVQPSGVEGTGAIGTLGVTASINISETLTGIGSTGAVGDLGVVVGTVVGLTGVSATGGIGTLSVASEQNIIQALTGIGSTGSVGTLTITVPETVSEELTGVGATGSTGTLTVSAAGMIWTEITAVTTTWTEI